MYKTVKELCKEAHINAVKKGFHDDGGNEIGTYLALIHSEVSEALEADRVGDRENFEEELADVCIRVFDLCGLLDIDLEYRILEKMAKNKIRPKRHGKLY